MKKTFLFIIIGLVIIFTGCQKDETDPVNPSKSIEELTISKDFKWNTAHSVSVSIKGLPTLIPVHNVLIISTPDGTELYKAYHVMSEDASIVVNLRSTYKELLLKYGSLLLTSPIKDGNVEFSFIPSEN